MRSLNNLFSAFFSLARSLFFCFSILSLSHSLIQNSHSFVFSFPLSFLFFETKHSWRRRRRDVRGVDDPTGVAGAQIFGNRHGGLDVVLDFLPILQRRRHVNLRTRATFSSRLRAPLERERERAYALCVCSNFFVRSRVYIIIISRSCCTY